MGVETTHRQHRVAWTTVPLSVDGVATRRPRSSIVAVLDRVFLALCAVVEESAQLHGGPGHTRGARQPVLNVWSVALRLRVMPFLWLSNQRTPPRGWPLTRSSRSSAPDLTPRWPRCGSPRRSNSTWWTGRPSARRSPLLLAEDRSRGGSRRRHRERRPGGSRAGVAE